MGNSSKEGEFICYDCFKLKQCKEKAVTWAVFFIALIATISIRAVNVFLDFSPFLAKVFWYTGVGGFFLFFIYKFNYDHLLQIELQRTMLKDKLLNKTRLSGHDYEVLGTIVCRLSSKKDKINYFFIFLFSGIALVLAVYMDFFK